MAELKRPATWSDSKPSTVFVITLLHCWFSFVSTRTMKRTSLANVWIRWKDVVWFPITGRIKGTTGLLSACPLNNVQGKVVETMNLQSNEL